MALAAGSALAFAFAASGGSGGTGLAVTAAFSFNAFATAGWAGLDCLSAESFAAENRAAALGALTATGRIASISAQLVDGALSDDAPTLLFITALCMFGGAAAGLVLPEPRGTELM